MLTPVVIELLRHGRPHNQLVSPTLPYLLLVGNAEPAETRLRWEHRELRERLGVLRYERGGDPRRDEGRRRFQVDQLGREIADLLGGMAPLRTELSRRRDSDEPIHLRMVLGGDELAMVPWELARVPDGLDGAGLRMLVDDALPVTLTREVRGASRRIIDWAREPQVLFVVSDPREFPERLVEAHLLALHRALEGWGGGRAHVDVLLHASARAIGERCEAKRYTHVHVLAHGEEQVVGEDHRFGLRLRRHGDREQPEVVSGEQLAGVLQAGSTRSPTVVVLASCDSGQVSEVLVPGGSVAHELHRRGVPWVVASQLPLTAEGSATLAEVFYPQVLTGRDPRVALREARRRLHRDFPDRHDWASLVVYASVPGDFDAQLAAFRRDYIRRRRFRAYDRLDALIVRQERGGRATAAEAAAVASELEGVLLDHDDLRPRSTDDKPDARADRAIWRANRGSILKRLAEAAWARADSRAERHHLAEARDAFKAAMHEGTSDHWAIGQWLVLECALEEPARADASPAQAALLDQAWTVTEAAAYTQDPREAMWIETTRMEVALCGARLAGRSQERWRSRALKATERFVELSEGQVPPRYQITRQLWRYVLWWRDPRWEGTAEAMLALLEPVTVDPQSGQPLARRKLTTTRSSAPPR